MISFIVPVYNGERFLHACADSILNQSVREIELIFVNDGSTDGSARILAEYAEKDARVRVLGTRGREGVSAARNMGLSAAKGEYLWFFDCDDVLHEGAAQAMLARAEETNAELTIAGYCYLHEGSGRTETVHLPIQADALSGGERIEAMHISALGGCKLWRAAVIRANGLRYGPYRIAEDVGFYLCGLACCARVAVLHEPVYDYRVYDGSSVQSVTLKALDCIGVFDETAAFYAARGGLEAFERELLTDRMFHYLLWLERLPRLQTKAERRQMTDALEQSRRKQNFAGAPERAVKAAERFDARVKLRRWYESNAYACLYRAARRAKRLLKR